MENEITKYVEYLFALAIKKCGDVNDAGDLIQETLLAAFQYINRVRVRSKILASLEKSGLAGIFYLAVGTIWVQIF